MSDKSVQYAKLEKNVTVNVYEDPLTEERLEGNFVPHTCLDVVKINLKSQIERWTGHFYGENMVVERTIKVLT